MYKVRIARPCGCIIKNEIEIMTECETLLEAQELASDIIHTLKNNHCKAHNFFIRESSTEVIVDSKFNTDDIKI